MKLKMYRDYQELEERVTLLEETLEEYFSNAAHGPFLAAANAKSNLKIKGVKHGS